jgi:predicted nucleotidyltransferase component of viral defense system
MFHLSTVKEETYSLLKEIFSIPEINNHFALAGGTSLALQIGHRVSIDLDIFSQQPFNTHELEIILSSKKDWKFTPVSKNSRMLFCYINNIKCDFVQEPAVLLKPFFTADSAQYFSIEDIAAMKMHTICGRGKRKDFFDIYALLEQYGWDKMLQWFEAKYTSSQYYYLWRSISYFDDANEDAPITGLPPYTKNWEEIKELIIKKCTSDI